MVVVLFKFHQRSRILDLGVMFDVNYWFAIQVSHHRMSMFFSQRPQQASDYQQSIVILWKNFSSMRF